jgi:hypothetical protein
MVATAIAAVSIDGGSASSIATVDPMFTIDPSYADDYSLIFSDGIKNAAVTPLPSSWGMMLGALIGLGFFAYRGKKKSAVALAIA